MEDARIETDVVEPDPFITIDRIHADRVDSACIVFTYYGLRVSVTIFLDVPPVISASGHIFRGSVAYTSLEQTFVRVLWDASRKDSTHMECENLRRLFYQTIIQLGKNDFMREAFLVQQAQQEHPLPNDMESVLFPETRYHRLVTGPDGCPQLTSIHQYFAYQDLNPKVPPAPEDVFWFLDSLPWFTTKELTVCQRLGMDGGYHSCTVLLGSKEVFCKAHADPPGGIFDRSLRREIDCLRGALEMCRDTGQDVQIPILLGYVKHSVFNHIIGYLCDYVAGTRLDQIIIPSIDIIRREKWAIQVLLSVLLVHAMYRTWGSDWEKGGIIIDSDQNAWVVGFSGLDTKGWFVGELECSEEADKEALRKLFRFLRVSIPDEWLNIDINKFEFIQGYLGM